MSINQTITLSGQDDIAPDEIDFPENSFFYIGGKAPPNKVLGTQLDGTLDYLNNDFHANSIRADGTPITQRITCFTTEILIEGQMNLQSSNPILIEGEYHNDSHLGIKDDKMGWYLDNITPFKIELLDDDGNTLTRVECMGTDILFTGECHFTTDVPFKIDEDIGGANKVLGCDGTGVMRWLDDVSPVIPTDANLDINSLIVEGFVPNIASYGAIIKTGLRVDGLASFKGTLGVVIDEILLVQKNIDCRASIQLHDNLYMTATSNISINGEVGLEKQVLGKDDDNNLKWITLPPPETHGLITGLNMDADQLDLGIIATKNIVEFLKVNITDKIQINGVAGTKDQIIVANEDGTIRWDIVENISPTPDPDGVVVNFIDSNVRPANQQAIEWERILDCRLINTLKNGSTSNHQRIVSQIDLRNNMPDVGTGHASPFDPWAHWYFRKPRGIEEIVHFDFSFLVDVKKLPIFIPQLTTDINFWALQVGFKVNSPYSLNMNIILHSTKSPDVIINTTNKAFRLFYRNNTGTTLPQFPNETYAIGALPCNLNLDIKLHYKADSNIVDMYLEGWSDVVLKTASEYTSAGNTYGTRVFYEGMNNFWYDTNIP